MEFKGRRTVMRRINLAPLIDVVFLLLIFFLLTSSSAWKQGISIRLPRVRYTTQTYVESPLEIYVTGDKSIYVNQKKISLGDLPAYLKKKAQEKKDQKVLFHAERKLLYEDVCRVLETIKKSGFSGVVLRTQAL